VDNATIAGNGTETVTVSVNETVNLLTLNDANATFEVENGATLSAFGGLTVTAISAIEVTSGELLFGGGSQTINGGTLDLGVLNSTSGILTTDPNSQTAAVLTLGPSLTLNAADGTIDGGTAAGDGIINESAINVTSSLTLNSYAITNDGSISGGSGSDLRFNLGAGGFTNDAGVTITADNVSIDGSEDSSSNVSNEGTITSNNGFFLGDSNNSGDTFTNDSTITGDGSVDFIIDASRLINDGTINVNVTTLSNQIASGSFDNEGTINLGAGDTLDFDVGGSNNKTISLGANSRLVFDGGTLGGSGDIVINNGSTLEAQFGTLADTIDFAGIGTLQLDGPNLVTASLEGLASGDVIDFPHATLTNAVLNNGGTTLTVTFSGGTTENLTLANPLPQGDSLSTPQPDGNGGYEIIVLPAVLPTVSSIAASGPGITDGNGDVGVGDVVTLTVSFSGAVAVNTAGGTPTLNLNDGGAAVYSGGSGTSALTFTYKVATGQNTSDLSVEALGPNGGVVAADVSGASNYSLPGTLQIDTTLPTTPVAPTDSAVINGEVHPANDTSAQTLSGTAEDGSTVTVYNDSIEVGTTAADATTGAWSYQIGALPDASYSYTVTATDAAGNVSGMSQALAFTVVPPSTPSINTTQQPASATVGTSIADEATVTGGYDPTGTVTFELFSNSTGSGTPLFTEADVALVAGVATSTGYAATATGTDYWVATYNGDSNNSSVTSDAAAEPVTITLAIPSINTAQQPTTAVVGTLVADQATVTGGDDPTGTVTFNLYINSTGSGTPLFTDADVALVNGVATSAGYTATATGTDYWVATYNGDANNSAVTSDTALEPITVTPTAPSINTTQQPPTAVVGTSIADQTTVTGGDDPTGTVTFNLYSNSTGSGTPLFTDANVALVAGVATSTGYTANATGTDYWVATYNGDANNNAITSADAAEPVTVTPATPTLTTSASATAGGIVGTSVLADSATLAGGFNAGGTISFTLTAPDGTTSSIGQDTVTGAGTYNAPGVTATEVGTYTWHASYSGDANNNGASENGINETVTVIPASPTITTQQQPATATVGTSIADQATVTGGDDPTGTVTFNLYNNATGIGTPLFIEADVALVAGIATSTGYTATATGTDYWVTTYNGDANNSSITSGSALEPVTITPSTPTVTATSSNVDATASQTFEASSLFSASASLPILTYEVEDESTNSSDGFWVLNGAALRNGQVTTLTAAQLSELEFVAGSASTPVIDTLKVAASDAAGLGAFTTFTVTAAAHAPTPAPTVTAANELQAPNQTLAGSSLFLGTASGNNTITSYEVEDTTPDSGHWVFNGVVEPTNQIVDVTVAQLAQLSFDTGYGSDNLMVRANDGSQWGSFTTFTVTPPPNAAPPAGTSDTLVMQRNSDGAYEFYDIGHDTILLNGPLGEINPALQLAGIGSFNGTDTTDLLMRNSTTGVFTLYDVSNNNITGNVVVGQVGLEWTVAGVGDFSGNAGETDLLMRNSNSGVFEVFDIANNAITFAGPMGQVGLEWSVAGFGDFSTRANETDILMRNSNSGAFEVFDVVNNTITSAGPMGQVGLEWSIAGFGDFSTRANETDMLMRNSHTGAFELFDIVNNTITFAGPMGQVGLEWTIAGFGDFSGNANETDMLMRNSNTGAFELFDISNNAITSAAGFGQVGLEWSISGVSATPAAPPPTTQLIGTTVDPAVTSNSATAQFTQAIASFAPTGAAPAASSPLEQATPPSATAALLTTSNHS
jgi:hypothetical protein